MKSILVAIQVLFVMSYCAHFDVWSKRTENHFPEALNHSNAPGAILIPDIGTPFILSAPDSYEPARHEKTETEFMQSKKDKPCIIFMPPFKVTTGTVSW